ncbi:MAG: CDP-glycerol:poly(glycerophosphate) glycerophosphotransferase [Marmoricola sp.]|nr:CDP-glycerol:poly(glycerophosphate) glycerophosphotransferase [Marmoricola sp.]
MQIVWNSFHGRYSDSPRALHDTLVERAVPGLEHTWLAHRDHRHLFPDTARVVDIDGPEATTALERADLVVASSHVRVPWKKPTGTRFLQTWHGTPLKRVHRDVLWAPDGLLDELDEDVAKWDLLLSPNAASTPRLRGAFGFDGEVLESGLPRNDLLSSPRVGEVRERLRAELGIPASATVVLYAPTWRDKEGYDESLTVPLHLDLEAFAEAFGDDPEHEVVLLVRAHYMVTSRWDVGDRPWLRDVSLHPDIAELYAVADVMVTDYSSTMFDFAITGRPLLFLADDLEEYADSIRGFYFDLLAEAPGPVTRATPELVEALRSLPDVEREHASAYAAFRERYCALEDGHATERVLERLGLLDGA